MIPELSSNTVIITFRGKFSINNAEITIAISEQDEVQVYRKVS